MIKIDEYFMLYLDRINFLEQMEYIILYYIILYYIILYYIKCIIFL
jgi:hypothetical protein